MSSNIKRKAGVVVGLLLFAGLSIHAEPVRLQHGRVSAPFTISFPRDYQYQSVPNPALKEIQMHYFTAEDLDNEIVYGAMVMTLPRNLGTIDDEVAEIMLDESLSGQIAMGDYSFGNDRVAVDLQMNSIEGHVSRYYLVTRNTSPKMFSAYLAFMRDRTMVSLWFTALDNPANRKTAEQYYATLDID